MCTPFQHKDISLSSTFLPVDAFWSVRTVTLYSNFFKSKNNYYIAIKGWLSFWAPFWESLYLTAPWEGRFCRNFQSHVYFVVNGKLHKNK
jgi:hypothetical protein